MTPSFVQAAFPELSLEGRAAPTVQGGLTDVDHPYDASGTPLPYIEQGGQREYFDGLRGTLPMEGGMTPPTPQAPEEPQYQGFDELIVPAPTPQPRGQERAVVPIPPFARPPYGPGGIAPDDAPQDILSTGLGNNTARIPPSQRQVESNVADAAYREQSRFNDQNFLRHANGTLGDMLDSMNINLRSIFGGSDRLRGRSSSIVDIPPNDDYIRNANALGATPDFNTPDGLSEFNRRMGLNIGTQVRSQAAQDRLRRGGYTTTPVSWHTRGRAADIRPRDINGLTGQAAVNEVRRRLTAAGYTQMDVIWESGRGRHQGTGPHVHIEPTGSPQ